MKNKIINTLIILFILVIIYYVYSIYFTIYESLDKNVSDFLKSDIDRIDKKINEKNKRFDDIHKQVISMKTLVKTNSDNIIEIQKNIVDLENNEMTK